MSKPQYMNQTLSLNGRKVVSLVAFALFTSFRLPTLSYVVFFFCSSHIIISMLQEGLSSRSCSIDPAYQTSLTYCFFSAIGFTSAIADPCMWGNQPHYDWSSSLFSKSFILSYMATNYWVSDLRIGYGVKTFIFIIIIFFLGLVC